MVHPRHVGTEAASALPAGTLLGPPLGFGAAFDPLPAAVGRAFAPGTVELLVGFAATADLVLLVSCVELVVFVLLAPFDSLARFTFSFSRDPPVRTRDPGPGCGSARPLPLSFVAARDDGTRLSGSDGPALRFVPWGSVAFGGFSRSGESSSSDTPNSSARLRIGSGLDGAAFCMATSSEGDSGGGVS